MKISKGKGFIIQEYLDYKGQRDGKDPN